MKSVLMCPFCDNDDIYKLGWDDDEGGLIVCMACGNKYKPQIVKPGQGKERIVEMSFCRDINHNILNKEHVRINLEHAVWACGWEDDIFSVIWLGDYDASPYPVWPTDEQVSIWAGRTVIYLTEGKHPGHPEILYKTNISSRNNVTFNPDPNQVKRYEDGEPCGHRGCCNHFSHPCEICGRIGCRSSIDPS